jgi:transposase
LDAATRQLQVLSRLRDDHVEAKTAASNQLGALLDAHWPTDKTIFSRLASDIALAFLSDYPTPQSAARLDQARMAAFCRRHSYHGGRSPAELLRQLHSAPVAPVGIAPGVLTQLIGAQIQLLRTLLRTITELDPAMAVTLERHPKTRLLQALPRIGQINLAQVITEVGPVLERVPDVERAAAETGAAPVPKASGKTSSARFRWTANNNARNALHTFASNSRHSSIWANRLYTQARCRGKRHPHAVRILARAWLRVIWACWHSGIPYDPHQHRAEQRLAG